MSSVFLDNAGVRTPADAARAPQGVGASEADGNNASFGDVLRQARAQTDKPPAPAADEAHSTANDVSPPQPTPPVAGEDATANVPDPQATLPVEKETPDESDQDPEQQEAAALAEVLQAAGLPQPVVVVSTATVCTESAVVASAEPVNSSAVAGEAPASEPRERPALQPSIQVEKSAMIGAARAATTPQEEQPVAAAAVAPEAVVATLTQPAAAMAVTNGSESSESAPPSTRSVKKSAGGGKEEPVVLGDSSINPPVEGVLAPPALILMGDAAAPKEERGQRARGDAQEIKAVDGVKESPQSAATAPRSETPPTMDAPRVDKSDAAQAAGTQQVDRVRFVQRVARAFETVGDRGGSLRLRLSPPELGSLRLEISVRNGALSAQVEAETSSARDLLLQNLPQLRERLAQQDIRIERFSVDLADRSLGDGSGQTAHQQHQPQPRPQALTATGPRPTAAIRPSGPTGPAVSADGQRLNVIV